MQCERCGYDKTKVSETAKLKKCVLRERVCLCCGKTFYTEETAVADSRQSDIKGLLRRSRWLSRGKER